MGPEPKLFASAAWALALLAAPLGAAAAEPASGRSAQLDRCLDYVVDNEHGSRWPATVACWEDELSAQDLRLQTAYRALEAAARRLGPRAQDQIATSRRQWTLYRDSWCAFEQDHAVAPNPDIARLSCQIGVTKAQLARVAEQAAALR